MNRRFLATLLLFIPLMASAQVRLSIDERSVQVAGGKKMTTERSIYLHPDGRLVSVQHSPQNIISITNSLGEMRNYNPATNEVVTMNNKEMSSSREMITMFASGSYTDMALSQYGFRQSSIRREEGVIIKTFTPASTAEIGKVELVFQQQLPICMLYYNAKDECIRKVYFSRYEYGRIPMPMRVTDVEYTPKRDSIVTLNTYSNLMIGESANSDMFDWQIPSDAKRTELDLNKLFQK